jgi:RHH-type transcriptional regulator, proline utilization regulon repressor / proline dehydrogenase / delta 1-pyrroline-5-carboxylate dehydrogenase
MKISKTTFESAKEVAASWQSEIDKSREASEKKFHEIMKRMLKNPMNKVFLIELLDQSFYTTPVCQDNFSKILIPS